MKGKVQLLCKWDADIPTRLGALADAHLNLPCAVCDGKLNGKQASKRALRVSTWVGRVFCGAGLLPTQGFAPAVSPPPSTGCL